MKVYPVITLFLVTAFLNMQAENNDNQIRIRDTVGIRPEGLKDSIIGDSADYEYNMYCCESGFEGLMEFFSIYLSPEGVQQIKDGLIYYRRIESETDMAEFYRKYLSPVSDSLMTAFVKFGMEYNYDYGEHVDWWNGYIMDCIPFMYYSFDNTIEGAGSYQNLEELLERSKQTDGNGDDAFFKALITCYGFHRSDVFNYAWYYDQSRGYPSFGTGDHYRALKSVTEADTVSALFRPELEEIAEEILDIEGENSFAVSKEAVYHEINLLLNLKDSTRFDLSNVYKLKEFLDKPTTEVWYNCLKRDCPE